MKECVECGKKLGIIEGYRHPTMGKDHLLCSNCFDIVSESVERYKEFISAYIGFFHKESSIFDDFQKIGDSVTKKIRDMQHRVNNIHLLNTNPTY